jgi:hypothetical protein
MQVLWEYYRVYVPGNLEDDSVPLPDFLTKVQRPGWEDVLWSGSST